MRRRPRVAARRPRRLLGRADAPGQAGDSLTKWPRSPTPHGDFLCEERLAYILYKARGRWRAEAMDSKRADSPRASSSSFATCCAASIGPRWGRGREAAATNRSARPAEKDAQIRQRADTGPLRRPHTPLERPGSMLPQAPQRPSTSLGAEKRERTVAPHHKSGIGSGSPC